MATAIMSPPTNSQLLSFKYVFDVSSAESTPVAGNRMRGRRAVTAMGTTSVNQKMEMMAILYVAFAA